MKALRDTFLRGRGAPLLFLWVAGVGLFVVVWPSPPYAALWTGLVLVFAGLTARDALHDPAMRRRALRAVAGRRVSLGQVGDAALREAMEESLAVFVEIVGKIWALQSKQGDDPALSPVIADAAGLLQVQCEAAQQVEECRRVLRLTGGRAIALPEAPPAGASKGAADADAARQRLRASAAIEQAAEDAQALVVQIGSQLETLLLQLHQVDRRAGDLVQTAQVTRQARETLQRLQTVVDARRAAADEVMTWLLPDGGVEIDRTSSVRHATER